MLIRTMFTYHTIPCGHNEVEHDMNLKKFEDAARKWMITFNDLKSIVKTKSLQTLGYIISKGELNLILNGFALCGNCLYLKLRNRRNVAWVYCLTILSG